MNRTLTLVVVGILLLFAASVQANITLTSGNSTAQIDTSTNMSSWIVDGKSQVYEQDWWIRVGEGPQYRLGDYLSASWTQLSDNVLQGTFTGNGISAIATYILNGGAVGSKTSDIAEILSVTSTGREAVTIYQYCDFDLGETPDDDYAKLLNQNTIQQTDGTWRMQESVVPTPPAGWEIGPSNTILSKLQNQSGLDLAKTSAQFGPGDATFAWQWDMAVGQSSLIISKDKHLSSVPEPFSVMLGLLGFSSIAGYRKLRRK